MYDVAIIGAGPAGLSAALILGRCRRSARVIDSGQPRNSASRGLHGFLTRDGVHPQELRRLGREELRAYPSIECSEGTVKSVGRMGDAFELTVASGETCAARLLLFATGREDVLPDKPGFREFMGRGVYHCPYCDGWEHREGAIVLYAPERAVGLALELLTWTDDLTVCTDGGTGWTRAARGALAERAIRVRDEPVVAVEGEGRAERIRFAGAEPLACDAVFFCGKCVQKSLLPLSLGCTLDADGAVRCEGFAAAGVRGVYVAGNVRRGLHLAIAAAAEGAHAAIAINDALNDAGILPERTRRGDVARAAGESIAAGGAGNRPVAEKL